MSLGPGNFNWPSESGTISFRFVLWIQDIFTGQALSLSLLFTTKLVLVMQHHGVECRVEKLGCYLQGQSHSYGFCCCCFYNQTFNMTLSSDLMILLPPNLVWWEIITSQSVQCKCWVDVFQVKITINSQNFSLCFAMTISSEPVFHWNLPVSLYSI